MRHPFLVVPYKFVALPSFHRVICLKRQHFTRRFEYSDDPPPTADRRRPHALAIAHTSRRRAEFSIPLSPISALAAYSDHETLAYPDSVNGGAKRGTTRCPRTLAIAASRPQVGDRCRLGLSWIASPSTSRRPSSPPHINFANIRHSSLVTAWTHSGDRAGCLLAATFTRLSRHIRPHRRTSTLQTPNHPRPPRDLLVTLRFAYLAVVRAQETLPTLGLDFDGALGKADAPSGPASPTSGRPHCRDAPMLHAVTVLRLARCRPRTEPCAPPH
ncbi:hypothetical protein BD626DRAFT_569306 [Schizophyllum amplum]|uniref:Uncharacterized protein n=1 Tax=Schizophyllum amplum TaxID=97359 RepID=A0A550CF36_9AGAR|nr:hypothetical protein BD626DRAFT_569306 [Auriculariopsis ampla]